MNSTSLTSSQKCIDLKTPKIVKNISSSSSIEEGCHNSKKKTELCKKFSLGLTCKFGSQCSFAHGNYELLERTAVSSNYKTVMCRDFHQRGYCAFGSRCTFVHSKNSRNSPRSKLRNITYQSILQTLEWSYMLRCQSYQSLEDFLKYNLNIEGYKKSRLTMFKSIQDKESIPLANITNS